MRRRSESGSSFRGELVVDVPDLLDRLGIEAKRKGRELWACCPFHEEKTPSWQIRDDDADPERHARWRCLGACHDGGSAVGLVMRLVGLERPRDAVAWLRSGKHRTAGEEREGRAAIALSSGVELVAAPRARLGFRLPAGVRFAPFDEWPRAAREYLEGRGVGEELVERWGLGFAVDGRLAKRVVLPWREPGTRAVVGYTARAYLPGEKKKHLEPGRDEGAATGRVYGEELWPTPRSRTLLVLVEGAFDGFAAERAGYAFGAVRGSNFAQGHAARLSTWPSIVVASDPDEAGERFAARVEAALARHSAVRRARVPRGSDLAKLAEREGLGAVRAVVEGA